MPMKFYMTPGSCTTGIHILLEEIDEPFEVYIVNLPNGDHFKPDYVAINPKSTIPTLVCDDGTVLTEWTAIAYWLARRYPRAKLLPADLEGETRAIEMTSYAVNTIHMQGFARIFTTGTFTANAADHPAVQAKGRDIIDMAFRIVDQALDGRDYVTGGFSIADAALFYVSFWADKLKIDMPDRLLAHYQRMRARPVVRRVLAEEGYR